MLLILRRIEEMSDRKICGILFLFLFVLYWVSPQHIAHDSSYSIHTSVSFLKGDWGSLKEFNPPHVSMRTHLVDEEPYGYHPIGVSLISTPIVLAGMYLNPGWTLKLHNGGHSKFEYMVSSFWAAALGVLFLKFLLTHLGNRKAAILTAFLFCFCSSVWSLAAMALWQHGPLMLTYVVAMDLLFRAATDERYAKYVSLPLAVAFIIRPTAAIPVAIFTVYVVLRHRPQALAYLLLAAVIAVPWITYNFAIYGAIMPPSYLGRSLFSLSNLPIGLVGGLFSPARGLLIYMPILVFSVAGFFVAMRDPNLRPLHWSIVGIVSAHYFLVSAWDHWFGGHCFGPRMLSDILPFLFLYLAYFVRSMLSQPVQGARTSITRLAFGVLAAWSLFVHAQGALLDGPNQWNSDPTDVDFAQSRLWDWTDPPFFRFTGN